ncbi:hypothetical protein WICPIJ_002390 [Wickerhamomyces pijperi]|uniref:Uncharacterized protein n=1 Tax=Wickerhamomyces pijperi TaxID=599730 RepID=A0A9P8QBK7_WICPI|nr:hypothetical protein WICPIJ_002390 [Wickerhamomyces pijperi]
MLTKIPETAFSDKINLKACSMVSGVAPPPQSKKLAGLPPYKVMTSIVAMAKPAPLTKQPMLPSNLMKFKSDLEAMTSSGSSWVKSLQEKTSFCLKAALSSKPNLASIAKTLWSTVSDNGLISIWVASFSMKILYNFLTVSAASA